ncbi:MAG: FAD:protein FMN transferase [bacterium]
MHAEASRSFKTLLRQCGGVFLFGLLTACQPENPVVSLHGETMGTTYSVVISEAGPAVSEATLKPQIDTLLDAVNASMSTYRPDSELSHFNALPAGKGMVVSKGLIKVLLAAREVSEKTAGAYDVTVGPLVNLWGFGPEDYRDRVPPDSVIAEEEKKVGYENLEIEPFSSQITKHISGLYVDLSSIAKGYGVDAVAAYLEKQGVSAYLVEIGGEVKARGSSPRGDAWKIGIEKPQPGGRSVQQIVPLHDQAIATSGDYRNYFEADGVRYSHTIDARTGRPITHRLVSVSVLADDTMTADAWATALDVLGEKEGFALAEKEGLAAYLIYKKGEGFATKATPAFTRETGISAPAEVLEE